MGPLYDAFIGGGLSRADFAPVRNELADRKAALIDRIAPQIALVDPATGMTDPRGVDNLYQYQALIDRKIAAARAAGQDLIDLFDPPKPDYVGKPETLTAFRTANGTQNADTNASGVLQADAANASQGGETSPPLNANAAAIREGMEHARETPSEAQGEVPGRLTPVQALRHYLEGSGKPLRVGFDQLDTSAISPKRFPQVQRAIAEGRKGDLPRAVPIDDKLRHTEEGDNGLVFGDLTLRLQGTLFLSDLRYKFVGALKSYDDEYKFYASDHRDLKAEVLTRLGTLFFGKKYSIEIRGNRQIESSGRHDASD